MSLNMQELPFSSALSDCKLQAQSEINRDCFSGQTYGLSLEAKIVVSVLRIWSQSWS